MSDGYHTCDRCHGEGVVITCIDDLCANSDHCIHGDGEETCPECGGSGEIYDFPEDWHDECDGE